MSRAGMAQIKTALRRGIGAGAEGNHWEYISFLGSVSKPMAQVTAESGRGENHSTEGPHPHCDLFLEAALGKHSSLSPVISTAPPIPRGQGAPSLQQCRAAMQAAGMDAAAPKLCSLHPMDERCCSRTILPYGKSQG